MKSSRDGNLDEVRAMISSGADINEKDENGVTALMLAADNSHPEVVSFLLKNGADPSLAEIYGNTALHYAKKCVECAKLILDKSGKVDPRNDKGATPLSFAAYANSPDVVKFLIQSGADVNSSGYAELTPLLMATVNGASDEVVGPLVKAGADIEHKDSMESLTPLFHAALDGNVSATSFLIAAGANICVTDREGKPILEVIGENISKGIWRGAAGGVSGGGLIGAGVNAAFSAAELRKKMRPVIELLENAHAPEDAQAAKVCSRARVVSNTDVTTSPLPADTVTNQTGSTDVNHMVDGLVQETSDQPTTSAAASSSGDSCFPPCRSGFICHNGVCVSACNPPCEPGFVCNGDGECVDEADVAGSIEDDSNNEEIVDIGGHSKETSENSKVNNTRRYKGFFFEAQPIGLGFCMSKLKYKTGANTIASLGVTPFGILVGGAPVENLTLYGTMRVTVPAGVDRKVEMKVNDYRIADSLVVLYAFIGGGVRYNLPSQFFVAVEGGKMGGPKISNRYEDERNKNQFYVTDSTESPDDGWYIGVDAGKEWWMGSRWTIGLGIHVDMGRSTLGSRTYYRSVSPFPEVTVKSSMNNFLVGIAVRLGMH